MYYHIYKHFLTFKNRLINNFCLFSPSMAKAAKLKAKAAKKTVKSVPKKKTARPAKAKPRQKMRAMKKITPKKASKAGKKQLSKKARPKAIRRKIKTKPAKRAKISAPTPPAIPRLISVPIQQLLPPPAPMSKPVELQMIPEPKRPVAAPAPILAPPAPFIPPKTGAITPDLSLLPAWEGKSRLNESIIEEGFAFALLEDGSPAYKAALAFINEKKKIETGKSAGRQMVVDCHDKKGELVASMLFYSLPDLVFIAGSRIMCEDRKRELHQLMYAAALTCVRPKNVMYATERKDVSEDMAGRFILLGRGYGMGAIPINHPSALFFLRRVGREYDFLISGPELSKILENLKAFFGSSLDTFIADMGKTIAVALVQLPLSPDAGEHLHEIQDAAVALSIPAEEIGPIIDMLKTDYILHRKDIIPEYL